jgi:hypothetical protein
MTTSRVQQAPRAARRLAIALALATVIALPAALGTPARSASGVAAAKPRALRPTGTQRSPGWYPTVDPESMSVVLGRRTNAPLVKTPFTGGTRSMKEMGQAVCRMLHHNAADSLFRLCVSESEFRDILWREFPSSRPATGLTWEDGWQSLSTRLLSGTHDATGDYGGRYYEFLRWERVPGTKDSVTVYKNFKLHNGLLLVARGDDGQIERMHWLRSIAERKGRFKIYSTND